MSGKRGRAGSATGTSFNADLARVLALKGKEQLRLTVLDRDHALVEIHR